jgi:hypothetical protein
MLAYTRDVALALSLSDEISIEKFLSSQFTMEKHVLDTNAGKQLS